MSLRFALVTLAILATAATSQAQDAEAAPASDDGAATSDAPDQAAQAPAPTEGEQAAQEHLDRAMQLLEAGDLDAAIAELERGYELVGDHPLRHLILYNMGKAHEQRFRYDLALDCYRRYLDQAGPDAAERGAVEATIRTLEGLLGTLVISVNVPSAEVWMDDRQVGVAPGRVLIPGGTHAIEIRAEGYVENRREVQLTARSEVALEVELVALAEEYRGISPVFFWGSVGIAGASAIAGAIFGILALSKRSEVDALLEDPVDMYDGAHLEEMRSQIQNLALAADILYGAAALFGVTAIVLAFFTDWGGDEEASEEATTPTVRVDPLIAPGILGAHVGGTF